MIPQKESLQSIMRQNNLITYAYSRYLNLMPRFLTPDMVKGLADDCQIDTHTAFLTLFAAACGLDTASDRTHRELERLYIRTGVRQLSPEVYRNDLYYRTVHFPAQKNGAWETREEFYAPYEPFVCNHPTVTDILREIPQIGYFTEQFRFPAILENGVEWMTVTPNEIETMRKPIENSVGSVLTLGLGLGYFAFHAAQKSSVTHVTVIERDRQVIDLFRALILPQFPHAEKIEIIEADALDFLKDPIVAQQFDSIFADLWHDQSDGLPLYLQLRRIEETCQLRRMDYWIEPTLLSSLRHMVWERLNEKDAPLKWQGTDERELLSDAFLRRLAADISICDQYGLDGNIL